MLGLAGQLGKPVLVEGPAGTGKTGLATSAATATDSRLIRLQCYEGLDEARALYEWNHSKQLLRLLVTMARNKLLDRARQERAARRDQRRLEAGGEALQQVVDRGDSPSQIVAGRELLPA